MRSCLGRDPAPPEVARFEKLFRSNLDFYRGHQDLASALLSRHIVKTSPQAENAAWVATVRMIMNLDEFIVRD